jgi:hypothetical protein
MGNPIKDGTGDKYSAKVDSDNRLRVQAVSECETLDAANKGDAYNLNTGLISITGDATLIYFKNTDADNDFIITGIALGSFEGICHSDDPYITLVRNPIAGDLISDGTAVAMNQNRNFGSSNTLTANIYKGKVGGTLTGGNNIAILQATPGGRSFYTINFLIPQGSSLGITLTANRSSGTANWYAALIGYTKPKEN